MNLHLEDCPMCGCAATFVKHSAGMPGTQGFDKWDAVACKHCRTTIGACDRRFRCREDAATAWNRRIPATPPAAPAATEAPSDGDPRHARTCPARRSVGSCDCWPVATPAPAVGANHATKENGDCPHWCRACAIEREERAGAVGASVQPVPAKARDLNDGDMDAVVTAIKELNDGDIGFHGFCDRIIALATPVQPVLASLSDAVAVPGSLTEDKRQALAFGEYLKDCDKHAIQTDTASAFLWGWRAAVVETAKPVAWRAWFDADNGARWLFSLWPEEEKLDVDWQPLYLATTSTAAQPESGVKP